MTESQLPCVQIYRKYGLNKSHVEYLLREKFHIPLDFQDCFSSYHLLVNSASHFLKESEGMEGLYYHDEKYWQIEYVTSRGKIMQATKLNPHAQVCLSYREANPEFGMKFGYVLVKLGSLYK